MLDHIVVPSGDLAASRAFYEKALAPLDYAVIFEFPGRLGLGVGGKPDFWLRDADTIAPVHVAFGVPDRGLVDAFHVAALAAGGRDNGGPGVREIYHPHYYGAFVLDPDGHNVEAVCHLPAGG